jgi:hypothetical protein
MKEYTNLDEWSFNEDIKVLQNVEVPVNHRKNTIIVQNININKDTSPLPIYEAIFEEIHRLGGIRQFTDYIYKLAIEYYGGKNKAAIKLGVHRRSLQYFEDKQK